MGGGLDNLGTATLTDTIVVGNSATVLDGDIDGTVTGTNNLIGTGGSGGLTSAGNNRVGVTNPGLGPLGDYGGPTQTIPLLPGSPAIAHGSGVTGVTDQRGFAIDSPTPDIGAFQTNPLVVSTTTDGFGSLWEYLSLRQAVNLANALNATETISFSSTAFAASPTITLTQGPLVLTDTGGKVTITDPPAGLIISGNHASSVFQMDSGVTASLSGLTITGGSSSGNGGAILNEGTLTLDGVSLIDNTAQSGGAIFTQGGSLSLANCTIAGNTAALSGGGIEAQKSVTVVASTFADNVAAVTGGDGGAIDNSGGKYVISIEDTIFSSDSSGYGPEVANAVISFGHNLVSDDANSSGWIPSDQTGTAATPLQADLGTLDDYGGPNETIPLLPGSPAIAKGIQADFPGTNTPISTDARGFPLDSPTPDIGAFQAQSSYSLVVQTAGDSGAPPAEFDLRGAIDMANVLSATETITFNPNVFATAQTITLTRGLLVLFDTGGTETITGPAAGVTVSGNHASGVFQVNSGVTASLSGLTITAGSAVYGGGMDNLGTVTLTDCTLSGDSAQSAGNAAAGGGLVNKGTATLTNCTISGKLHPIHRKLSPVRRRRAG